MRVTGYNTRMKTSETNTKHIMGDTNMKNEIKTHKYTFTHNGNPQVFQIQIQAGDQDNCRFERVTHLNADTENEIPCHLRHDFEGTDFHLYFDVYLMGAAGGRPKKYRASFYSKDLILDIKRDTSYNSLFHNTPNNI